MADANIIHNILFARARVGFSLTVLGNSMEPILHQGDTVEVQRKHEYKVGDIIVFLYKDDSLIIHRLLKIENNHYFCKGDNSFRLEDIDASKIVGAIYVSDDKHNDENFITASLEIARLFKHHRFDREKTMNSQIYNKFKKLYLF